MTLREIEVYEKDFLTPAQAAGVLGCAPYAINRQAKERPDRLGFPVVILGKRVKIPKEPFLLYMKGWRKG